MLKPKMIADYLALEVPYRYFANEFPVSSPDAAAYVRLMPGIAPSDWSPRKQPGVQIIVRGLQKDAVATEAIADSIYTFLHQKTEFYIGGVLIRRSTADQSIPLYVGRDDNDRLLYSINFTWVVME